MVLSSILTFARTQAQTDSNGLTDANGLIFANEALLDFHRRLVNKGVDASQITEASIVGSSSITSGVYAYPTNPSMLFLKTMEINYADTTNINFKPAQQMDTGNLPSGTSMGMLRANASQASPQFDDRGDTFEIVPPGPQLVRLFYFSQPSVYTTTGDSVLYPENLDPGILGWRVAANYLYSLKDTLNMQAGDKLNSKYEERVQQFIGTLGRGEQKPIQAQRLPITGFEF